MIVETIYAGRDNTFSLRLIRGGVTEQLQAIRSYDLVIEGLRTISSPAYSTLDMRGYDTYEDFKLALHTGKIGATSSTGGVVNLPFIEKYSREVELGEVVYKDNLGIVEVAIGPLLTEEDVGSFKAYLVTYDAINTSGVKWPSFKLKVK